MKFCSECGAPVEERIPVGDDRPRWVCTRCETVHYQNPKLVVGTIAEWQGRVLLCRRAIEPRAGFWTVPAGYLERGESTREGAARETLEEANARVEMGRLFAYLDIPRVSHVYVLFLARLLDVDFAPGAESLEVRLFEEPEIPWADIAFPSVRQALELYFDDRSRDAFELHVAEVRSSLARRE